MLHLEDQDKEVLSLFLGKGLDIKESLSKTFDSNNSTTNHNNRKKKKNFLRNT